MSTRIESEVERAVIPVAVITFMVIANARAGVIAAGARADVTRAGARAGAVAPREARRGTGRVVANLTAVATGAKGKGAKVGAGAASAKGTTAIAITGAAGVRAADVNV
jgi:hypothetical protein